jgi:hypothetical protein
MSHLTSLHCSGRDVAADVGPFRASASMRSRFEALTQASRRISPGRAKVLGLLVGAADPRACGGSAVLRPLWANEAMHRAWSQARLLLRLDQWDAGNDPFGASLDLRIAEELVQSYRKLHIRADTAMQPCSQVLRDVVTNVVELFCPAASRIRLRTVIDPVVLAEFKRRALVLLASELVTNALMHAFEGRTGGEVNVVLQVLAAGYARLVVTDDGGGMRNRVEQRRHPVLHDLADLLESDLDRRAGPTGGTCTQVVFSFDDTSAAAAVSRPRRAGDGPGRASSRCFVH